MAVTAGFMLPHPPLIVPAIGKGEEQAITDTQEAYRRAAEEIAALRYASCVSVIACSSPFPIAGTIKGG